MATETTKSKVSYSILIGIFALLIFLANAQMALPTSMVTLDHDNASQFSFAYFTKMGFQYGTEVINNIGPYGFLHYSRTCFDIYFWESIIFYLSMTAVFSLFSGIMIMRMGGWLERSLCFIVLSVFPNPENFPSQVLLVCSLFILTTRRENRTSLALQCLAISMMAFIALMKSIGVTLSFALLFLIISDTLIEKKYKKFYLLLFCYISTFITSWLLAGQSMLGILDYLYAVFAFSSTYQEAMTVYENDLFYRFGMLNWMILLSILILSHIKNIKEASWVSKISIRSLLRVFAFLGCAFVAWKHGFVRADVHVQIFYHFSIILFGIASPWILIPIIEGNNPSKSKICQEPLLIFLSFFGICLGQFALNEANGPKPWKFEKKYKEQVKTLFSYGFHESKKFYNESIKKGKENSSVSENLRKKVGDASIDHFGYEPGILLVNGFNYRPRPMAITFVAVGEYLRKLNASYYGNPEKTPEFIFVKKESIDNRFTSIDDADAFMMLLKNYKYAGYDANHLILRKDFRAKEIQMTKVLNSEIKMGEFWKVPDNIDGFLYCKLKLDYSFYGKLKKFLYKPDEVQIVYRLKGGTEVKKKIILSAARAGFLLYPSIEGNVDLSSLLLSGGDPRNAKKIESLTVHLPQHSSGKSFDKKVAIELHKVNNLSFKDLNHPLQFQEMDLLSRIGYYYYKNRFDDSGKEVSGYYIDWYKDQYILFSQAGTKTFVPFLPASKLLLKFGLLEKSYTGEGKTDGVAFVAFMIHQDGCKAGKDSIIWQRYLNPLIKKEDRGKQNATIDIPKCCSPKGFLLYCDRGPHKNHHYDWSYWADIYLKK